MKKFAYYIHKKYHMTCLEVTDLALDGLLREEETAELLKKFYESYDARKDSNVEITDENIREQLLLIRCTLSAQPQDKIDKYLKIWQEEAEIIKTGEYKSNSHLTI